MRFVTLLMLLLIAHVGEAISYSPHGYIASSSSYYPLLADYRAIEEMLELRALYGFMSDQVRGRASRRIEEILSVGLPIDLRVKLLLQNVDSNMRKLDNLPDDVKDALHSLRQSYLASSQDVRSALAIYSITRDKSLIKDESVLQYIENHKI